MDILPYNEFKAYVEEGIQAIPKEFRDKLDNVAIFIEDYPTREQLGKMRMGRGWTLFGLYEGVPQQARENYTNVVPDKITIFRYPLNHAAQNIENLKEMIKDTVWHEIAHHFGMNEAEVRASEARRRSK